MNFLWYEDDYQGKFLSVCIDSKTANVLKSYQNLVARLREAISSANTDDLNDLQTQMETLTFLKDNNSGDTWPNVLLENDEIRARLVIDDSESIGLIAVLQQCVAAILLDKDAYHTRCYHLLNAIHALMEEVNKQVEDKL